MTTYRYRGQSLDGAKVTGVIRAYDEFEAVSQLRDRCAFITKIEPVKEKQGNPLTRPVNTRIREKELAMLCSQLSILLSSGLTALRCLQMVAAQTRNKQLRRALEKAAEEVGAGRSMADSLESNREVRFPATFVETVRAVNFYNYNNRDRELKELYLCGGGAGIAALRETIAETTRLEVHPATDLLPEQQRPEEEPWLYLRAIAGVFESFRGGKR